MPGVANYIVLCCIYLFAHKRRMFGQLAGWVIVAIVIASELLESFPVCLSLIKPKTLPIVFKVKSE